MELAADLHVHTVASGHAFSTIQEIAEQARIKGLGIFGVADHGPCIAGAPSIHHFRTLRFVPRYIGEVMILRGAEANIINDKGEIDIPERCLNKLDYAMAGFHDIADYENRDKATNTKAMINAMDNPYIRIITHPGNPKFPVDYEEVVAASKEKGVALEINNASFVTTRLGSIRNCEMIAGLIVKYDAYTVIGSDAHISFDVGNFEEAVRIAKNAGIKDEKIINTTKERLFDFLKINI